MASSARMLPRTAASLLRAAPQGAQPIAPRLRQSVRQYAKASSSELASIKSNCRKVMCIGRNYADHVTELNNQRPKQPFFFLKPPSAILLPDEGPVLRPGGVSVHYEIELGLVISKTVRDLGDDVSDADILQYIDRYVLAIDMTGRNVQEEAKKKGLPWSIAKGFDTFLPLSGPIGKETITDPHNVEIYLKVNGQEKQRDSTELMLFRIPRQLRDISRVMTLEKGDIILTGTPKGVGPVVTGDVIEAGLSVGGKEVDAAKMRVEVKDREGAYMFKET
ncbi:Hypothetical protein R9X50_00442800 [Acrodontium crateriforme]|uniref:Fumarylacetoacetase-like C-terminal domain-containing protein n=1 Tax=Acrodontium crateriforme TaxID=150365 RepID=A0AAQ3M671_9PEZI|nr:Hypothetical protein R9X50_00442800 [Acrodontium crateriforme]